jgi:hypothetical protein
MKAKTDTWHHSLSPSSRQDRLELLLNGLRSLADAGLAAASVLANLHHRRIVPLVERKLRIYEMTEYADPIALARSQLLRKRFPRDYVETRARCAVNLRTMPTDNDDRWSFIMLPEAPPVSRIHRRPVLRRPPAPCSSGSKRRRRARRRGESGAGSAGSNKTRSTGCASSGDSLPPRLRRTHHRTRRRKKRAMGVGPLERWNPPPLSPRAAEGQAPVVGTEAPAAGRSMEEAARAVEAPASAAEAS